jgi:hypothetical protein
MNQTQEWQNFAEEGHALDVGLQREFPYQIGGVRFVAAEKVHPDREEVDFTLSKTEAERLLREHGFALPFDIMAGGYGDDEDYVGLTPEDLDEDGRLEEAWEPFEVWPGSQEVVAL